MKEHLQVGFIGNFTPPYSTENDRKWSLQRLGHNVVTFQENQTTSNDLRIWMRKLDLLLYSHTHDPAYYIEDLRHIFREYKAAGIPTASVHLDLWRGLDRWKDVGEEATWFTEYVFTPDDTNEWPQGINHYYMRPGVIERDCYLAAPDPVRFPHEIVFVGSRGYHPEYPFREELISFLEKTYGDRFAQYGGGGLGTIRGHDLNTLYATAKVVVGDSCFGNKIKGYYSDRVPETTGRGGLLMHPRNPYIKNPGVIQYYGLGDLKNEIDAVIQENPSEMIDQINEASFKYTLENDTYTQIMQEILEVIYD